MFGFLISGSLLFGVGGYLVYQQIQKPSAAILALMKLPGCEGMSPAVDTQTAELRELNRKLDVTLEQNRR